MMASDEVQRNMLMSLFALYEIFFIVATRKLMVLLNLSICPPVSMGNEAQCGTDTTWEPQGNHVGKLEGPSILMGTTWVIPEGSR